ncbi:MAG: T9SS type A sorting domain-containing protein [Chlorobi bacterium]|nr:T9SS type A sorting domain-containing protein [Chlorobiota bacterium]
MRKLLFGLIMLMSISAFAQPQLTWEFRNPVIVPGANVGDLDSLRWEVWVSCDMAGYYSNLTTVAFDYPNARFGENAWSANMSVARGTLLLAEFSGSLLNNVQGTANTFPQTFSVSTQTNFPNFDPAGTPFFFLEFPTTPDHWLTITMAIQDNGGLAEITFAEWLMNGQQFFQDPTLPPAQTAFMDPNIFLNPDLPTFPLGLGTPGLWTGAVSSDWFATGNWDDGNVPTATTDVTIPVTANDPAIATFLADCQAMQIDAGATLHIMDDGGLTAAGVITNDGSILMHGTSIGGSLIDNGFAGAGTFEYDRTLTNGAVGTHFGWHYVSSPVDNTVTGDFVGYWVKDFDEASGMFMDIDAYPGDCSGSMFTVSMGSGMGYSVKQDLGYADNCPQPTGATGDIIEFGGDFMSAYPTTPTAVAAMTNVNTGDVLVTLTGGGSNWNLMGNPYASGWDYDDWYFNGDFPGAGLNDAIYYWDADAAAYASYVAGVGTNGGTNEVQTGQAFFLEADGTVPNMPMTFTNSSRIHTTQTFYKSEVSDIVRLVATGNNFSDETVIRFLDEATTGWDKHFDAKKLLQEGSEVPSVYTYAGSDIISINSQPATELVPMAFVSGVSGTYTIEATETSEFTEVTLEDIVTGEMTDLLTSSYTFDYTAGENADRFVVHFGALGTIENNFDNVSIWSNENNIYVNVPMVTNGEIVVVNMMGQEIIRTDIATGINVIPVNDVNSYYIVKVVGSQAVKTGKVYIK